MPKLSNPNYFVYVRINNQNIIYIINGFILNEYNNYN